MPDAEGEPEVEQGSQQNILCLQKHLTTRAPSQELSGPRETPRQETFLIVITGDGEGKRVLLALSGWGRHAGDALVCRTPLGE